MPELPEVETTKRGLQPHLLHQPIKKIDILHSKLRLPIPEDFAQKVENRIITRLLRRGKYLILQLSKGAVLIHLGMSGHLRIEKERTQKRKHDHIIVSLSNGLYLHYNDPRRFGLWIYTSEPPLQHPLLKSHGPEPLSEVFNADYLYLACQNKKKPIKSLIMDNATVVGVGNIYATESLFLSKIHPMTPAGSIHKESLEALVVAIKKILKQAISAGGTTLKDFYTSDGSPGYFSMSLNVYGKQGKACPSCKTALESLKIGGRRSIFCPKCQVQ